ncbi:GNAT family N-acetyltransferase [Parasphingorhabdus sp.]|uniref:GNAT family N-acetyltransferase n=1 Tax=Parasphingorhabdus sp. TaxID=2709688 RepID=UPI0032674E68
MTVAQIPDGHIPTIITYLEMNEPRDPVSLHCPLEIMRWKKPVPAEYLDLFRAVGERWMWTSRLLMDEAALCQIIHHDAVELYAVMDEESRVGIMELDFRQAGQCEIGFFGLVPELAGKGYGRWLMSETLRRAWKPDVSRVWLHTCTADSPSAVPFYLKSGFSAYKREFDTMADPRLSGHLPRNAGPHIPIIS